MKYSSFLALAGLLISLFAPGDALAATTALIPTGSVWRYLDNGLDQGTAWQAPDFDDSGWAGGPAQLGYGDNDEATVVGFGPDSTFKYPTTYFRYSFTVEDAANVTVPTVRLLRDDGGVVYLNGIEIFRSNMPGGFINYLSLAASTIPNSDESVFFPNPVDPALLVNGRNVVAVEIHQASRNSSDLSFDLEFLATVPTGPPVILTQPTGRHAFVGETAVFSVSATGGRPFSYQWDLNGTDLPGATNATLSLPNVTLDDAGTYRVTITNAFDSTTSAKANLTVEELTAESFKIKALTGTGALALDAGAQTGSPDRGGIAVSSNRVFVLNNALGITNGLNALGTTLFNFDDLSFTGNLIGRYDSVVADLKTAKVYTLAAGATPLTHNGGTLTTLLELHDTTGDTNGTSITLSSPIDLPGSPASEVGIFAGFGRMLLHNGANAFQIALPSGDVTDLGAMPVPPHRIGSHNARWAYWGVAEFFDGTPWIVYVRDAQTIVRTRVPDGFTQTVATFTSLGNMFSFTVTPDLDRWYFEHDGASQFGSGNLTVGFADAAFAYVQAPQPPRILRQPQSVTVAEGNPAEFSVKVRGSAPLSYQWQFNGTNLPGAIEARLTLTGVTTNQAGRYTVQVSNPLGTVISSNATLAVLSTAGCNFAPTNRATVTFPDALQGTTMPMAFDGIHYWSSSGGGPDGQRLASYDAAGAFLARYSPGLDFRSLFTDATGTLFARQYNDPAIYRQVAPGTFVASGVTLNGGSLDNQSAVVLNGAGTEYIALLNGTVSRWRTNGTYLGTVPLSGFGQIPNEANDPQNHGLAALANYWLTYNGSGILSVWDTSGRRLYQVRLEGAGTAYDSAFGFSYCNGRAFIVDFAGGQWRGYDLCVNTPPAILVQPESRTVLEGFNVTLSAAVSGKIPLLYQWRYNGADLDGATNATLTLTGVTTNQAGDYSFEVRNELGTATSSNAVLTVVVSSAGHFQITSLTTNHATVVGNVQELAGDDRGGLAVTAQQVFYTGDSGTARFAAADLSGGTALGRQYDGLVSELGAEKVYALGDGTNLLTNPGGTVTTLSELDGATGELTGVRIPLTRPIVVVNQGNQVGIFAGLGRIVLHDGARAWDIELPSGVVVDLGAMPSLAHQSSENWAYWGVAEFTNGAISLVYVRDSQTIVRTRVPDGQTSTVGTFENLADMASISVSLALNRWYFHHQYQAQFSALYEVIGFADANLDSSLPLTPPTLLLEPEDQTLLVRSTAELRVVARGSGLNYQWRQNGTNLPGATNVTLLLTGLTTNQSGLYSVVVGNTLDTVTSADARLTVVPLEGTAFRISNLSTNNPTVVNSYELVGDDRGGIAASGQQVFQTGDSGTARFDLVDLSGGMALGRTYDALVSDLGTEKIYSLADGTNLISNPGGLATALLELDGLTGEPTGVSIPLSRPIELINRGQQIGIFAGLGRIILHDGTRGWHISLPSGQVTGLGPLPVLNHQYSDSWAYWGVAELISGFLWLDYVRDSQTIVRTRVPDGLTINIGSFNYLSDMASFTVSPAYNRWYFHHQSQSQFSEFYETIGFADASFVSSAPPIVASIVRQPLDKILAARSTAEFKVVARGTGLRYQWKFEGADIPGATTATLRLSGVAVGQSGYYSVVVSNVINTVLSSNALLTVVPLTGETLRIASLTTNNPTVVDDSTLINYDRGGIAVSDRQAFFNGGSGAARFDVTDLSGGARLEQFRDALVSDLGTEKIYSLGNDTNLIVNPGGIVTTLLELDGLTGEPTGTRIPLSQPLDLVYRNTQVGIFAGVGRIVLHDGTHAWQISVPSGSVLDLGPMAAFDHQFSESWAYWGVAEFFNGDIHLVYVRDSQTIVRRRVPDGATSTVATFNNLSDMASITVSLPFNRWYFQHQYQSEFSSFYLTMGFADAAFTSSLAPQAPSIVKAPANQTAAVGATAEFSVAARGSGPLRYQWLLAGTNLPGATNATLALRGLTTNQAGSYSVVVGNAVEMVTSAAAQLDVIALGGNTFRISALTANRPTVVDDAFLTGGDRGGMAASSQKVLFSGANATASFGLEDLTGATSPGRIYHALVSDLGTEKVYSLGNGTNLIESQGGRVTTLLELDQVTARPTGASIALSLPIDLPPVSSQVGIFAGVGRIVLHDGARAWSIELPSGLVVSLGSMPAFNHQVSETWAYWGVAEFFNGDIQLAYVRDSQTIVRTRVPDGVTTTIATFNNLSDTASITVSLALRRWYFHHQYSSQFSSFYLTMGSADATFVTSLPPSPAAIVQSPADQTVAITGTVDFQVGAKGTRPLRYQWLFEGITLAGATNATLTLSNVTAGQAGRYVAVVTNAYGAVTSAPAVLRLLPSITVGVFDDPNFVSTASGDMYATSDNLQASLRRLGHTVVTFTNITAAAASQPVLLFPPLVFGDLAARLTPAEQGALRSFVARGGLLIMPGGSYYSTFLINDLFDFSLEESCCQPVFLRTALAAGTAFADDPVTLPYNQDSYQLLTASLPPGSRSIYEPLGLVPGVSSVALMSHGAGKIVYLGWNWVDAFPLWRQDNGWLTVLASAVEESRPGVAQPPEILVQPADQSVLQGLDLSFAVIANGSPLSYQWLFNGTALPGETNLLLVLHSASPAQSGAYSVVLSNALAVVASQVAMATVQPTRGVIAYFTDGNPSLLGPERPILQAGFTPRRVSDFRRLDLARVPMLFLDQAFEYGLSTELQSHLPVLRAWVESGGRFIVHDRFVSTGLAAANPLLLGLSRSLAQKDYGEDIDVTPPGTTLVTRGPHGTINNSSLDNGGYSHYGFVLRDSLPLAVSPILQTGTSATQVVALAYGLGAGLVYYATIPLDYLLERTDSFGRFVQTNYTPNVIEFVSAHVASGAPVILDGPQSQFRFRGAQATFQAAASGAAPLRYQWRFNGDVIAGATDFTLVLANVSAANVGAYTVEVANDLGSALSAPASLEVLEVGVFKIASLSATGSRVVDHDGLTGDDRGGIALSSNLVFYTGDNQTARFSAVDLSGGAALGRQYDALVGNLRTERVYSLANDSGLIGYGGDVVTALIEIDGSTGLPTSNRIELSSPINAFNGTGLFAGYDCIALHNGERVYRVEIPSGFVTDLGVMNPPNHQGCESWAYWGVTEFFNGEVYLVTVQDYQTIVRTRVPDGQSSVVASFNSLSDMCSFTFSPARNRWYFHHEGNSQFGGNNETIGYATGAWDRPPRISNMANSVIDEDAVAGPISFSIVDTETVASNVVVTAHSSNQTLLPDARIVLGGVGSTRSITLAPATNQNGTALVTITLTDSIGQQTNRTFTLTVNPLNDAPSFSQGAEGSVVRTAFVLSPLRVTNVVVDPDFPSNRMAFRLAADAPAGARINPSNGVFVWTPSRAQAQSSNFIRVMVTDDGVPPLSATNSFSVLVGDFLELIPGGAVLQSGQSGSVPVLMTSSTGVTNLSFLIEVSEERLTNLALQSLPVDVAGSLQRTAPNRFLFRFDAIGGASLFGTRPLGTLAFTAISNSISALVPLNVSGLAGVQENGVPVPTTIANDGRVVVVGSAPLLEALIQTNGQRTLSLYGIPQTSYTLESTTNLIDGASWSTEWHGTLTNLFHLFDLGTTNQTIFYRGRE